MVKRFNETGDPFIAPSVVSYNTLINAWAKSDDPTAPVMAEKVLGEMLEASRNGIVELKPDAISFSTVLDAYARRSDDPNAARRCEELFQMMDELGVKKNVYTFCALQNVFARKYSSLHVP